MSLKLTIAAAKGQYDKAFQALQQPIARAATAAIEETRQQVLREGRAQIAAGGLGAKFANALRGTRYPRSGYSVNAAAWIHHAAPYAAIFEHGGRIAGQPLLWLPLRGVPQTIGGRHMTPRLYEQQIGQLHTIRAKGHRPMLAGYMRGRAKSKVTLGKLRAGAALARLGVTRRSKSDLGRAGLVSVPLFIGLDAVNLKKRFDLAPVFERARAQLAEKYARQIAAGTAR